ncbi:hypothetical protein JW698_02985 [Candidatus Wolfebacteria bacterium]|nr:hypothetical protein [Candidatus Wolfebacteria bacterium]
MELKKKFAIIINFLRITLAIAIITSIFYGNWSNLAIASLNLLLTFLPSWFKKKYNIYIPLDLEFAGIILIYASLYLGEIRSFYIRFWWWDVLLHFIYAIAFALIGFIILFLLFQTNKIKSSPFLIAVFSFCFSVTIGVLWELFEYFMDQTFGLNMQKSGLRDTIWDLITNCAGAGLSSFAGYAYIKGVKPFYFSRLIKLFIQDNPKLLKNKN